MQAFAQVPRVAVRSLVTGSIVKSRPARSEERDCAAVKFCSRSSIVLTKGGPEASCSSECQSRSSECQIRRHCEDQGRELSKRVFW